MNLNLTCYKSILAVFFILFANFAHADDDGDIYFTMTNIEKQKSTPCIGMPLQFNSEFWATNARDTLGEGYTEIIVSEDDTKMYMKADGTEIITVSTTESKCILMQQGYEASWQN